MLSRTFCLRKKEWKKHVFRLFIERTLTSKSKSRRRASLSFTSPSPLHLQVLCPYSPTPIAPSKRTLDDLLLATPDPSSLAFPTEPALQVGRNPISFPIRGYGVSIIYLPDDTVDAALSRFVQLNPACTLSPTELRKTIVRQILPYIEYQRERIECEASDEDVKEDRPILSKSSLGVLFVVLEGGRRSRERGRTSRGSQLTVSPLRAPPNLPGQDYDCRVAFHQQVRLARLGSRQARPSPPANLLPHYSRPLRLEQPSRTLHLTSERIPHLHFRHLKLDSHLPLDGLRRGRKVPARVRGLC